MKIGPLTQVLELYQKKNDPVQNRNEPSIATYDTVSISREAYERATVEQVDFDQALSKIDMGQLMDEVTLVDRNKVQRIKDAIANGNYQVNPEAIANQLIDEEQLI